MKAMTTGQMEEALEAQEAVDPFVVAGKTFT